MPSRPVTAAEADQFAREWIAAWNSHDLERILSHYAEDVVFTSPFIVAIVGREDATVRGHEALRDYFTRGLGVYPDLHFVHHETLAGAASVAVRYTSVGGREAVEVMELDGDGLVCCVTAHYTEPSV
ncbi:MAG TPA: nuclear transport factor 2 family protein [Solirubrobacterales bacterium]|nr:nuclear transport factor 2 family protein [Solirubrobacterales bacterium]